MKEFKKTLHNNAVELVPNVMNLLYSDELFNNFFRDPLTSYITFSNKDENIYSALVKNDYKGISTPNLIFGENDRNSKANIIISKVGNKVYVMSNYQIQILLEDAFYIRDGLQIIPKKQIKDLSKTRIIQVSPFKILK